MGNIDAKKLTLGWLSIFKINILACKDLGNVAIC